MIRWWLLLALLLPFVGSVASIAVHQAALADASHWRIPVSGYDPRDPLRGQYVRFSYEWLLAGDPAQCLSVEGCDLCLDKVRGLVRATAVAPGALCTHRVDVRRSRLDVRPERDDGSDGTSFTGRIFISEARAPELQAQLQVSPMLVEARLDAEGRLVPRRLVPAP